MGETQEVEYADRLAMVRRAEGTFEVKIAEDNVLLVGGSVLHSKTEVSDHL